MKSFREPTPPSLPTLSLSLPLPIHLAISATAPSLIGLLVSGRMIGQGLTQLGIGSEELLRGDRLPPLPLLQSDAPKA
ncbi:MAG: hypothetical protein AAF810_22755 [Cyanobacteria bacterium P01_D01_bin.36]